MTKLIVILSSISLSLMFFFSFSQKDKSTNPKLGTVINELYQPKGLNDELTEAEKYWQQIAIDNKKVNQPSVKIQKNSANELTVGNEKIYFHGVFFDSTKPFVLLKLENGNIKQMYAGDKLANGAELLSIDVTKINFILNNNNIEFNLFERKNDDN
ncbi:hypothetical protein Q4493_00950 [Colwellia sp. 1_MG-2023]|uniref:hypothetical protein n=1 Tax=Colwellia sp. 1_MG-2023 TaxID=3062649 RepID=UPI0026E19CC7|nr:hypothetical protein [Colwellia sp. 1_MG-2023]MDO6444331.1 hypothetical protein [Colwellia sp. 1_MG-2023]